MARSLAPAVAWLALATSANPAVGAVEDVLRHEEMTLPSGMRVLLLSDHRMPTVAVMTWYRVGSGDEVRGKTGLAHLFEHLMFKGSPNVPEGLIDHLAEEAGGTTNAFTASDMTVYIDVAGAPALERFLWIEGDRLARLADAIDQGKLDNQRDVVLNERRERYENQPYGRSEILLGEALWPEGHPYHAPGIGYVDDLKAVTLDDARAFFRKHYTPANAVMVIAGDLDVASARKWASRYLGWIPSPARPGVTALAELPPLSARKLITATDDVQVPRIYMRWRGPAAFRPEQAALDLAAILLAGGKASRLYQKLVVEQRVAQDVYAGFDAQARAGEITVRVTAKPDVDLAKLQASLDRELDMLAKEPPSDVELERAKNIREADFLRGLADLDNRGLQLMQYAVLGGDAAFLVKDLARYRGVTARELQAAVARSMRSDGAVVLTINPRKPDAR